MTTILRGSDNFDTAGGNAVKAWVNFNGVGTVAIWAAFNISSITDNGVGDYTINFTNAFNNSNYAVIGTVGAITTTTDSNAPRPNNYLISSVGIKTINGAATAATDFNAISIVILK